MARARNIKPGFYKNEDLAECSIWARFIFPGLWMLADREGRLEDRPKRIKGELLPYDNADVDSLLDELVKFGFILRYEIDGQRYIQILKFSEHQTPHLREQASIIPAPEKHCQGSDKALPSASLGSAEASPRSPDSLNPSSLIPESGIPPVEAPPAERSAEPQRGSRLQKDWTLPKAWGDWALEQQPTWTPDHVRLVADKFRDHWLGKSGKDGRKADWAATWRNWVRNEKPLVRAGPLRPFAASPAQLEAENEKAKRLLFGGASNREVIDV